MPRFYLGINCGFAVNRYPEPEVWTDIVGKRLAKIVAERNLNIDIGVDGNVSFENAPRMRKAGANLFVCGTSSLFTGRMSHEEAVRKFLELVAA